MTWAVGARVLSPGWGVPSWHCALLRAQGRIPAQGWNLALRRLRAGEGHPPPHRHPRDTRRKGMAHA